MQICWLHTNTFSFDIDIDNLYVLKWLVDFVNPDIFYVVYALEARRRAPKYGMLIIKPGSCRCCNEEL